MAPARRKAKSKARAHPLHTQLDTGSVTMSHDFHPAITPQQYFGIHSNYGWEGPSVDEGSAVHPPVAAAALMPVAPPPPPSPPALAPPAPALAAPALPPPVPATPHRLASAPGSKAGARKSTKGKADVRISKEGRTRARARARARTSAKQQDDAFWNEAAAAVLAGSTPEEALEGLMSHLPENVTHETLLAVTATAGIDLAGQLQQSARRTRQADELYSAIRKEATAALAGIHAPQRARALFPRERIPPEALSDSDTGTDAAAAALLDLAASRESEQAQAKIDARVLVSATDKAQDERAKALARIQARVQEEEARKSFRPGQTRERNRDRCRMVEQSTRHKEKVGQIQRNMDANMSLQLAIGHAKMPDYREGAAEILHHFGLSHVKDDNAAIDYWEAAEDAVEDHYKEQAGSLMQNFDPIDADSTDSNVGEEMTKTFGKRSSAEIRRILQARDDLTPGKIERLIALKRSDYAQVQQHAQEYREELMSGKDYTKQWLKKALEDHDITTGLGRLNREQLIDKLICALNPDL